MLDGFLDEGFWQSKTVRDHLDGVRLEQPDEEILEDYQEAVEDVEVFTGSEFEEVPELFVIPEDSPRELYEDGVYFEDANAIIFNPRNINAVREQVQPDVDWEPVRNYHEKIQEVNGKDVMREELTHGLQDQKTGVTNFEHSAVDNFSRRLGLRKVPEQPEFPTEGFADYVTSYLGNQSIELTEASVHLAGEKKVQEEKNRSGGASEATDSVLNHVTERYVGHLFYKAVEEQEGIDGVMNEAFNPRGYDDLDEVFRKIEESNIVRDEEVYEFSRLHMEDRYGF